MWFFGPDYREQARLRDGTHVLLRCVQPYDKARLREGFGRLSPESRYLRFLSAKNVLTDDELRYLTEVDGHHHVAIGAVRIDDDGVEGDGLGIARFIELEPGVAEAAIAVCDEVHGQGLGGLLFMRLMAAARERGIGRLRCEVSGSNHAMQDLAAATAPARTVEVSAGVVSLELTLPDVSPRQPVLEPPRENPLYKLFTMAAKGVVDLRERMSGPAPS